MNTKQEEQYLSSIKYSDIAKALSKDLSRVFCVNTDTDMFAEFLPQEQNEEPGLRSIGTDFKEIVHFFFDNAYEVDRSTLLSAFTKQKIQNVLETEDFFILNFRMQKEGTPVYVRLKATRLRKDDPSHILFSLNTIDPKLQDLIVTEKIMRYEQMREIANQDSLTGVKSKHAFTEAEKRFDQAISQGTTAPFAVVVCDVNGLKMINDTQGHQAGDDHLCRSCKMICVVFSHSPVYRIGGDEFVVILTGSDYDNRNELIRKLHSLSAAHIKTNDVIVACGMTEYDPAQDHCVRDIFERADAVMYKEKMLLKNLGAATRDNETDDPVSETEEIPIINIRKHILIADDMETNREILGSLLEGDYDILYASNGIETMEMLRKHKDEIALLLLDLYMPLMNGREVLQDMQVDEELMSIPVIMLTVDPEAELDSLKLGAVDFISKPYPDIAIVKARIAKGIELSENRDLIRHTERDKLTGLLHLDYFIQYVDRFEHQNEDIAFDAFVCDIRDFHSVNEKYGRQFGDLALRSIGNNFRKLARKTGGIGCRQGGDTFLLYCPHQEHYEQLIHNFYEDLFVEEETADKVRLRFGVFEYANRMPDIENRFVCARIAADSMDNDQDIICGYYTPDLLNPAVR